MAPPKPIQLHVAGRTDVGLVREHNEDMYMVVDLDRQAREPVDEMRTIDVGPAGAMLVVCDGMGGAAAGEVASSMAADVLFEAMVAIAPDPSGDATEQLADFARRLRSAAFTANRRIFDASRSDQARAGMGTTMTAVGVVGDHLVMAQVGDSRAYLLRDDVLTQVTRDQSLVNQLLETGQITEEQAKLFEHSNVILQALGVQSEVEVQLSEVVLRKNDRVVVCSDGLTGVVSDEELAAIMGSTEDVAEVCRVLVEMARVAGGPDNITVVAARVEGEALAPPLPGESVRYQRWRLDEPDEPDEPAAHTHGQSGSGLMALPAQRAPRIDPAQLFFSSMLLLALALGTLVVASLLYRDAPAVTCTLEATSPGLAIHVDGRDVGARTRAGETSLRLPPGRHRIALRGRGAPAAEQIIEATISPTGGATCSAARFDTGAP